MEFNQVRSRIILNLESCNLLTTFNKTLYERVDNLKIEKDTIQKDLVELFKNETDIKTKTDWIQELGKNPFFKEVLDSQRKFAGVVVPYWTKINGLYYSIGTSVPAPKK